jgi:hypothetical protein
MLTENDSSGSVRSSISAASSPFNSQLTTPRLEVINPRILEPSKVDKAQRPRLYNQDSIEIDFLETLGEEDIKPKSFDYAVHPYSYTQSTIGNPLLVLRRLFLVLPGRLITT